MPKSDVILFTVADYNIKVGLPPQDTMDNFDSRGIFIGRLNNVSKVAFSPKGDLYAVRGSDLFTGPMPSNKDHDWFSTAKRVGTTDWHEFKFLYFHPNGSLYGATKSGKLYMGPAPDNEHVSWLYGQATKIGDRSWHKFLALFFDPEGLMYGVTDDDQLVRRTPPPRPDEPWLSWSSKLGRNFWRDHSHFISFTPDGKLWCVNKHNGNFYKGSPPDSANTNYKLNAELMGWKYHIYPILAFTKDRTIQSILSFEFLPELGKRISQSTEVVKNQIYDNRGSTALMSHSFSFDKTIKESSEFKHDHGFTFAASTEMSFKTGVPFIAEGGVKITVNMSTTHTWSFTDKNETEVKFSSVSNVTLEGGQAVRMVASVTKADLEVPYRANVRTLFGFDTTIEGTWIGVSHFDLMVKQEDYTG